MIYTAPLQQEVTEMFRIHFWTLLMLSIFTQATVGSFWPCSSFGIMV